MQINTERIEQLALELYKEMLITAPLTAQFSKDDAIQALGSLVVLHSVISEGHTLIERMTMDCDEVFRDCDEFTGDGSEIDGIYLSARSRVDQVEELFAC